MNVLLVSDQSESRDSIHTALSHSFPDSLSLHKEESIKQALAFVTVNAVDVIVVNLSRMLASTDITISTLKKVTCAHPIIIITNTANQSMASDLVKQGVRDYLIDSDLNPAFLKKTILYAIERKERMQKDEQWSESLMSLLSKLSHDYDGHIRLVDAGLSILQDDISARTPLLPDEKEWFDLVKQRVELMDNQISGLVVYLKAMHKKLINETIDLNQLILSINDRIKAETSQNYQLLADKLPELVGDRTLITHAFTALIINGITYNENDPVVRIKLLDQPNDGKVQIVIKDNGVGIEAEYKDSIFDPFCRLHKNSEVPGSGLGLSIAKATIERHAGSLTVSSQLGAGSHFTILLPQRCDDFQGNIQDA